MKTSRANNGNGGPRVGRREVLRRGATGALLLTVLPAACGGQGASPPTGPVPGGNVSDLPIDSLRLVPGDNVVLGRDAGGLYAMSAVCTHSGCVVSTVGAAAQGLNCACHGSTFDRDGMVTRGPARSPLQHYQVDLAADGAITIQGAIPVSSDVRTTVA